MLPIKRLLFVVSALLSMVVLLSILIVEILPFFVYYIATGKYFSLSEKAQVLTFNYFEKKINETSK